MIGPAGKELHAWCPTWLGKRLDKGPAGLEPSVGARNRKKTTPLKKRF